MRRQRTGRVYVCDGGALGSVVFAEDATDRGPEAARERLNVEVLVELVALVAALGGGRVER